MQKNKLEQILGKGRIKENFNLSPYLTLRTKTVAQYYFEAESKEDLIKAKKVSLELRIPFMIIGGGSNLAVLKSNLSGLVIRNKYMSKKIEKKDGNYLVTVSSGYPTTKLAKELSDEGYLGLEYQIGLPGTVGGALYMNSKWTKPLSYIGDRLVSASLLDINGKEKKVDQPYFNFAYDQSILQRTNEVVLEATFKLEKVDPAVTKKHAQFALDYRRLTQPHGVFCSGCFFRNISQQDKLRLKVHTTSAGNLIDKAGLKGRKIGKYHVSEKHANFIINDGNGNPQDLKNLLRLIKDSVYKKFGVKLEEEVIIM